MGDARHPSLDERFDPAVRIVEYDPAWPEMAEAEIGRIAGAMGEVAVRIDHVGSTAVPGLAAKPIIDLQLSVADVDARSLYVGALEGLGYLFAPDPASPDFHFFGLPAARPRTHHLHVCAAGSEDERRHLAVRDYLRAHPDEVVAYAELKRGPVARAPGDRLAYIAGKDSYVAALERRALAWAAGADG
ncbi:MAG TPA: GrpB family protein [Solirubrobacterales bacterium]|nr:GrpB family protein [Solirubrobacterales bacterium]